MAKIGLITIISIVLNLFLTFWLINQYISDVYFQSYVNATIGQYYAFIVLTLGVGGGSGLGYLFLKRKHGDTNLLSKIAKSKSFKSSGPLPSTPIASPSRQVLPTGAPPSPPSRHTAYAVPPLPKSSTPSGSRSAPGTAWTAAGSTKTSLESILSKQDSVSRPNVSLGQIQRGEPTNPSSPPFSSVTETAPPQPLRSIGDAGVRTSPSWPSQQPAMTEKRPESGPLFQKPGLDVGAKPEQQFSGFSNPSTTPQPAPVPSKWALPSEEKGISGRWPESGVKSIPPLPTKWTPPSQGSQNTAPSAPQQTFNRPGAGPIPTRGPIPTPGGPRPFVIQGPGGTGRPGEPRPLGSPRPVAAPQPFRTDPNRLAPNVGGTPRPPQPAPRPAAPLGGPMPQPWTPPSQTTERREPASLGGIGPAQPSGADLLSDRQGSEQKPAPESGSGGGEMDWDTALDTILKTLRKDRVGDTK